MCCRNVAADWHISHVIYSNFVYLQICFGYPRHHFYLNQFNSPICQKSDGNNSQGLKARWAKNYSICGMFYRFSRCHFSGSKCFTSLFTFENYLKQHFSLVDFCWIWFPNLNLTKRNNNRLLPSLFVSRPSIKISHFNLLLRNRLVSYCHHFSSVVRP
jgi:hypothetical protein